MRTRSAFLVAGLAAVAVTLTGCPNDSCGPQTPEVSNVPTDASACTVGAGQQVNYQVRLCPSCNETGGSCTADLSQVAARAIYLDISTQACSGGESCPTPTCNTNPTTCTFTAPSAPDNYQVIIPNGQGQPYTRYLQVVASGTPTSCPLASGPSTTF